MIATIINNFFFYFPIQDITADSRNSSYPIPKYHVKSWNSESKDFWESSY